jgi:O-antigen/teichoic acid export membrane protein
MTNRSRDLNQFWLAGALSLTVRNLIAQIVNYSIHIGLGRFFAPAAYGSFGIIASVFSVLETVLRWGVGRSVAFHVARDPEGAKAVLKKSLRLQTMYGVLCFLVFLSLADRLAVILGDSGIASYLRWGAFFILGVSFVPVYSGFLSGYGAFCQQGTMTVLRSLAKLFIMVVLLAAGMQMYGVIAAYTASAALAAAYGFWISRQASGVPKQEVQAKQIVAFGLPVFVSALAGSLLMRMDLFLVQALTNDRVLTGFYTCAFSLIKAPYFLSYGTGQVVFRTVARLKTESPAEVRRFIQKTVYYYVLGLAAIPFILSASAEQILVLTFGSSYLPAVPAFKILAFCLMFMILNDLMASLIVALDRPRLGMILSLCLLPLQFWLTSRWISSGGLVGVALATTVSWAVGTLLSAVYLLGKGYLVLPKVTTFLKVGIASMLSYYVTLWGCPSGIWLVVFCPLVYLLYLGLLKLQGEFNNGEARVLLARFLPAKTLRQSV